MAENESGEIKILSPDDIRELGVTLPELNGITMWRKDLQCEFCDNEFLDHDFQVFILQWPKRSDIHLMCERCFKRMLLKSSSSTPEE